MWRTKGKIRPDIKQIVKGIMREQGLQYADICGSFGFKYPSNFSKYFNQDWDLNEFILLMHILNCELVIRYKEPNSNVSREFIL